eukprot:sb/3460749/
MFTVGDAKMTLYKTAEESRNKAFVSVLNERSADKRSDKVIEAVRNINRKGLPIAEEIYQALSSFISEPRELTEYWVKASRDALYIFLERGKLRVTDESHKNRLHEVIIKFLRALRDLDCSTESVKKVVAEVSQDVIGLAENTVFCVDLTDDHITLVMDLFAKHGTWITNKYFRNRLGSKTCISILWQISTHPLLKNIGIREIYKLRNGLGFKDFWDFGALSDFRAKDLLSTLLNIRETSPDDYLVKLSEFFLERAVGDSKARNSLGLLIEGSEKEDSKTIVTSVCQIIDLRETDPPELLLRLFFCLVRYFQSGETKFGHPREGQSPKKGQTNKTVRILGEEGAPGVEVTEQDLSSPILKSMLASSFEEGRTRTITVPSAPQRILEALKLILGEDGKGVEEHATLKEVWEWMLPWATMYQVDGVFKYLVEAMSRNNRSQNSMLSDDWLVEFVIRSKHPAWLMLVPDRFVLVESLNLPSQDLILAITELINALKDTDNYLVNIIRFYCQQQYSMSESKNVSSVIGVKIGYPASSKYFERDNYAYGESDYSNDSDSDEEYGNRNWWTAFMTEPPAKRRARCIESYYSTFPYSIPILISRKNLPPPVINSLLKILIEMTMYDKSYWKECYRSFVIDNFLPLPACYLQSLRFLNNTEARSFPLSGLQEVFHYIEQKMKSKKTLPKNDRLIYSELAKMIGKFESRWNEKEEFAVLLVSFTELNSKIHYLDYNTVLTITKMVLRYINYSHLFMGKLKKTLGDLVEEICVLSPCKLVELFVDNFTYGDAKMTLYKTAEASRNKAFVSVLYERSAELRSVSVIEAVRNIHLQGLPIAEDIYQALSSFISEPRESLGNWAKASRDALFFIFLERGKLKVCKETHEKRLHEVIIKFLRALRDLDCGTDHSRKEMVAKLTRDVIGLAEDKVFRDVLTEDHITLVMDLFAKYGTWFTVYFKHRYSDLVSKYCLLWHIYTHPLIKSIGIRKIYKLRQKLDYNLRFWNFGDVNVLPKKEILSMLSNLRETSPNDYLVKISELFLKRAMDDSFYVDRHPLTLNGIDPSFVTPVCQIIDLRETDPPELLLRLFLCLIRYFQGAQTVFEPPRERQSPKKGQKNDTVTILGEEGAPGVEVNEQDLSSPILKSMLASSFEEGRTRTITVPSAPQRILEALKLILSEDGEGVEEHATLKEVWEGMLPWATMYQVDEVFKYLVEAMSKNNRSQNSLLSDDWLVEFAIRSKHPAWLMLVPDRFVLVEALNLPPQDLILAITELIDAFKDTDNYLVNVISYYCQQQCSSGESNLDFVPNILPIFKSKHFGYSEPDDSNEESDEGCDRTPFMTEPPTKRSARCIESYCEDLRGLLVKSPDLWDFKAIQKVLNDIFRLYCKSLEMNKDLKNSTFPYSIPILISRKNLPPPVINSLLKILTEMKSYENSYWQECYRSFVMDNFLPVPACYLQSLRFINMKECRTRTITVPSAPQRILEALKLILGEDGKGVEKHATLKEVWEWMLPWATMYQVDGVFKYEAMSKNNRSQNSLLSDDWLVEFAIRSKHPAWLMLVPDRFVLVEALNLPPQDLILAITELIDAFKDTDNYLVNVISYYCQQQCSSGESNLDFVPNILPIFKSKHFGYSEPDDSNEESDEGCDRYRFHSDSDEIEEEDPFSYEER